MFVDDWRRVLLIGYSTWAFVFAVMMFLAPQLIWDRYSIALNPDFFKWSIICLMALGVVGRIMKQGRHLAWLRRLVVALLAVLFVLFGYEANAMDTPQEGLAADVPQVIVVLNEPDFDTLAFDFISGWEGKENYAYLDIVNVPTICYGHTRTVTRADVVNRRYMTDSQCRVLLLEEIHEYRDQMLRHLTPETIRSRMPVRRKVAFTSLTINIGWGAVGRSTAVRRLNNGDVAGACQALTWFNKAGGVRVPGLENRRNAEHPLCMHGVA